MKLEIHAVNDIGCSRTNNEDMMSVGGILLRDASLELPVEIDDESDSYFYILVSDGMGGHEKGEEASELLLKCISDSFMDGRISPENAEDSLRQLVSDVSCTLNMRGIEENQERILGCTLTGVIWIGSRTYLVNAGDSRTYRLRNGILKQLTTDDTERGITGDENASKLLLNAIGGGSHGRLTVEDITDRIMEGDTILVCSDGLTDMVDDEGIEEILCSNERPAESLVETANRNGGADNISVIVAHLEN
jgi:protein phosphatase